jgi:GTP-dependent phosphoenolpyruvate carboxykinase
MNYIKLLKFIVEEIKEKDEYIENIEKELKEKILEKVIEEYNEKQLKEEQHKAHFLERQKERDEDRCEKCGRRDASCYC